MATILLFAISGTVQFEEMESYFRCCSDETGLVVFLILIAITGKSAQFGLHS